LDVVASSGFKVRPAASSSCHPAGSPRSHMCREKRNREQLIQLQCLD
jgi:hypothetical protein